MFVYVVTDEDGCIQGIYDEETFKKIFKQFTVQPPLYSNKDYWNRYLSVNKHEVNTENSTYVEPEEV